MTGNIYDWATRHNISVEALNELLYMTIPNTQAMPGTEGSTVAHIRLIASQRGSILWRNNNGAITDDSGRHVRFGLGNDSVKINKYFKSSDLIGITPVTINGKMLGIFTAIEVKKPGWKWVGNEREQAQWKYMAVVKKYGGFATFATSKEDYENAIS